MRSFPYARARDEIYRARDPAHTDWSGLARYFRLETGPPAVAATDADRLASDYLRKSLVRNVVYYVFAAE